MKLVGQRASTFPVVFSKTGGDRPSDDENSFCHQLKNTYWFISWKSLQNINMATCEFKFYVET